MAAIAGAGSMAGVEIDGATSAQARVLPTPDRVTIICIHGFMAPGYSQMMIARYLQQQGWPNVERFVYDSKAETIEYHGQKLAEFVGTLAKQRPDHEFYFLATSMGNLLLRVAFQREEMPESAMRGRHVAVGPPWRGASWGRAVNWMWFARMMSGDGPGRQLRTTPMDGFDYMGEIPDEVETLVITGNANSNWFIPKPNDGTVCEEETLLRSPHWRTVVPWGVHSLLNFSIVTCRAAHQFFLGNTDGFIQHPGLGMAEPPYLTEEELITQ